MNKGVQITMFFISLWNFRTVDCGLFSIRRRRRAAFDAMRTEHHEIYSRLELKL